MGHCDVSLCFREMLKFARIPESEESAQGSMSKIQNSCLDSGHLDLVLFDLLVQ
jgi:hypothetical protein